MTRSQTRAQSPIPRRIKTDEETQVRKREEKTKMAEGQSTGNAITLTKKQFAALLQQIQISVANITQKQDNFSRCTTRFDGNKTSDVEAFIDAIVTYKECTNTSDENALKGLPIFLTDIAATWWQGVKHTVNSWDTAIELLKQTYGPKKPAYRIYKELFAREQEEATSTDIFICKARALLSKLPYDTPLTESIQIDIVYGLLAYKIRKEILRDKVTSFTELLDLAREVEMARAEKTKLDRVVNIARISDILWTSVETSKRKTRKT
ncbi:PREDICTED: uncharacterized protein LOC105448383 [Wasmannia auropunctata]|uniref:uncharacterized protein LOC105448383 n=1 Tax=Wasmannia auropunctata TaxID=64793 RepID=UPI0005F00CD9|nr:PREDICTED: uncharacterized protein LOC105448383 [Wasmannia auropunctata]